MFTLNKCIPCQGGIPPLNEKEINNFQKLIDPNWVVEENKKRETILRKSPVLYPGRDLNPYEHYCSLDFKSNVSTNSTTRATIEFKKNFFERVMGFEPTTLTLAR